MGCTVERIISGGEGAIAVLSDLSLDVISAVIESGDEISARNYLIGRELDEERDGAAFDGVSYDRGGIL